MFTCMCFACTHELLSEYPRRRMYFSGLSVGPADERKSRNSRGDEEAILRIFRHHTTKSRNSRGDEEAMLRIFRHHTTFTHMRTNFDLIECSWRCVHAGQTWRQFDPAHFNGVRTGDILLRGWQWCVRKILQPSCASHLARFIILPGLHSLGDLDSTSTVDNGLLHLFRTKIYRKQKCVSCDMEDRLLRTELGDRLRRRQAVA